MTGNKDYGTLIKKGPILPSRGGDWKQLREVAPEALRGGSSPRGEVTGNVNVNGHVYHVRRILPSRGGDWKPGKLRYTSFFDC